MNGHFNEPPVRERSPCGLFSREPHHSRDNYRIDEIDEEPADEWNDDKSLVRRAMHLGDSGHVRNGRRGRSKRDSAKTCRDNGGFVVFTHCPEHDQYCVSDRKQDLKRENRKDKAEETAQCP